MQHIPTTYEPTVSLTQDQIDGFHREGYLSLPALTTAGEVAELRDIYDRLFAQRAGREEGNQFDLGGTDEEGQQAVLPQILNPSRYAPELNRTILLVNGTHITRQLFGPQAACSFAHAIYKPPRIGAPTPWHQDAAYWDPNWEYPATISIWVPLQEARIENGCMWFVPRSHEGRRVFRHQSIHNDPRIHGLELHPSDMHRTTGAIACPLPAGGCTLHGGYALHHTGPNISDMPRRALIINGGLPGVKLAQPRSFPWLEEKKTARMERAKLSGQKDVRAMRV